MPYLTPNTAAGDTVCRRFAIPVDLLPYFMGALSELTLAYRWEQDGALTPDEVVALFNDIISSYDEGCMVGVIFAYITEDPPIGSLALDGSTYDDIDYPQLAAVLDPEFDNGDGTFTLPDVRGRGVIGAGSGAGLTSRSVGETLGDETVTLTIAEIPSHDHVYNETGVTSADPIAGVPLPAASVAAPSLTGATGGGGAHENMPPSLALNYAVWFR